MPVGLLLWFAVVWAACHWHDRRERDRGKRHGVLMMMTELPKPDPRDELVRRCRRVLSTHGRGVISTQELHAQLADVLVHAGVAGQSGDWPHCFAALPAGVVEGLLAYLRGSTRHHGFFLTSPAKVEAARAEQARLVSALEARYAQGGERGPG